jgi:hypothetical protein
MQNKPALEENPMKKTPFIYLVILTLLLAACSSSASMPEESAPFVGGEPMQAPAMDIAREADSFAEGISTSNVYASSGETAQVERIVIKNANLTIYVDDPSVSVRTITAMAEEMGGFVVSSNAYRTTLSSGAEVPRASITIRVPAARLTEALDRIKAETTLPVENETISSQDVTSEYTDLQSRLRNLEAAEAQLQTIMDDAFKTEDVLNVYQQLNQVREQIEVIKGQIQYYEQSAALSSISVELMANAAVQPLTVGGWQPKGIALDAVQALINTLQFIAELAIWSLLYILPVVLVVFGPPILLIWGLLRWRARRKAKAAAQKAA